MSQIIVKPLNGEAAIVTDEFVVVEVGTAEAPVAVPSEGKVLVHLSVWEASKAELTARAEAGDLGV
jgi:uncharacterized protein (DUF934 family)